MLLVDTDKFDFDAYFARPDVQERMAELRREHDRKEHVVRVLDFVLRPLYRIPLIGDAMEIFWHGVVWNGVVSATYDVYQTLIQHIYYTPREVRADLARYEYEEAERRWATEQSVSDDEIQSDPYTQQLASTKGAQ